MKQTKDIREIRYERWLVPTTTWGLIPTMGFLHEGHLSLVRKAKQENDKVGVSIFINPIQFNNPDDLEDYPHNLDYDLELLANEGVDLVWVPTPDIVYPKNFQTYVEIKDLAQPLEGATRPGHFQGVATVVAKLFNVFQPHRAYFGQKDAQQALVIKKMVEDLNFNTEIITCPTVRETDGLAMSSRNIKLSSVNRKNATILYSALTAAKQAYENGQRDVSLLRSVMRKELNLVKGIKIDYISVADPSTLEELKVVRNRALLSMAVFFEEVRLIDNIVL